MKMLAMMLAMILGSIPLSNATEGTSCDDPSVAEWCEWCKDVVSLGDKAEPIKNPYTASKTETNQYSVHVCSNAGETCLPAAFRCDGEVDCPDGDDERFCNHPVADMRQRRKTSDGSGSSGSGIISSGIISSGIISVPVATGPVDIQEELKLFIADSDQSKEDLGAAITQVIADVLGVDAGLVPAEFGVGVATFETEYESCAVVPEAVKEAVTAQSTGASEAAVTGLKVVLTNYFCYEQGEGDASGVLNDDAGDERQRRQADGDEPESGVTIHVEAIYTVPADDADDLADALAAAADAYVAAMTDLVVTVTVDGEEVTLTVAAATASTVDIDGLASSFNDQVQLFGEAKAPCQCKAPGGSSGKGKGSKSSKGGDKGGKSKGGGKSAKHRAAEAKAAAELRAAGEDVGEAKIAEEDVGEAKIILEAAAEAEEDVGEAKFGDSTTGKGKGSKSSKGGDKGGKSKSGKSKGGGKSAKHRAAEAEGKLDFTFGYTSATVTNIVQQPIVTNIVQPISVVTTNYVSGGKGKGKGKSSNHHAGKSSKKGGGGASNTPTNLFPTCVCGGGSSSGKSGKGGGKGGGKGHKATMYGAATLTEIESRSGHDSYLAQKVAGLAGSIAILGAAVVAARRAGKGTQTPGLCRGPSVSDTEMTPLFV